MSFVLRHNKDWKTIARDPTTHNYLFFPTRFDCEKYQKKSSILRKDYECDWFRRVK